MSTQFFSLPVPALPRWPISQLADASSLCAPSMRLGPNDSSLNRGDRADTGDNEARPDEMGSGPAHPTVDPASFAGDSYIRHPSLDSSALEEEIREDDSFEIVEAEDGRLGLTNIGDIPADDWAADTGPDATPAR